MDMWILQSLPHAGQEDQHFCLGPTQGVTEQPHRVRLESIEHLLQVPDADILHLRVLWPEPPRHLDQSVVNIDETDVLEPLLQLGAR